LISMSHLNLITVLTTRVKWIQKETKPIGQYRGTTHKQSTFTHSKQDYKSNSKLHRQSLTNYKNYILRKERCLNDEWCGVATDIINIKELENLQVATMVLD